MGETAGPMLLGFDVLWIATILSGIAAFAVMIAIYAATTARDPMTKRVKALNDRREQLKAGITASTKRRAKLVQRNDTADRMRGMLSSMKNFCMYVPLMNQISPNTMNGSAPMI